jgi:2-polyprenyl-3-methyl-5-hydroxy-6-metoxy-1,4-benzoquinol methylase
VTSPPNKTSQHEISQHETSLHEKESAFHDQWAKSLRPEDVPVVEAFTAPAAMENRHILRQMGDLKGKRILDIGAGLGESSVYFAMQGAIVTYNDLSPEMARFAERLAAIHNVQISTLILPAESAGEMGENFDFVYIANTLHHVQRRDRVFAGIRQALRPGGWFFSWDPLAYNPIINIYRKMATEVRTPDERPLTTADLAAARHHFTSVGHREFWIASLSLFLKYYLVDRVHPNAQRYWKRILHETPGRLWWWWPMRAADEVLTRLPAIRWLAWNTVIWGRKPLDGQ